MSMSTRICWKDFTPCSRDAATAALEHFPKAAEYPENLSVGRPKNDPRAPQVAYYTRPGPGGLG